MTICSVISLPHWAGIGLGFAAAYYWFKASTVTVSMDDKRYAGTADVITDDYIVDDYNKSHVHLVGTWKEQSRLNKIAARLTALAVLCEALAGLLSRWF